MGNSHTSRLSFVQFFLVAGCWSVSLFSSVAVWVVSFLKNVRCSQQGSAAETRSKVLSGDPFISGSICMFIDYVVVPDDSIYDFIRERSGSLRWYEVGL